MEAAGLNIEEWKTYDIYEAVGCDKCNNSGYKGRMAIHEALYITRGIRDIIVQSGDEEDEDAIRKQARKDGTQNLRESGLEKVKMGLTSIQEIVAATTED
jgi:type IV pilus assembly protein PilB